jgi:hypothetical protein
MLLIVMAFGPRIHRKFDCSVFGDKGATRCFKVVEPPNDIMGLSERIGASAEIGIAY